MSGFTDRIMALNMALLATDQALKNDEKKSEPADPFFDMSVKKDNIILTPAGQRKTMFDQYPGYPFRSGAEQRTIELQRKRQAAVNHGKWWHGDRGFPSDIKDIRGIANYPLTYDEATPFHMELPEKEQDEITGHKDFDVASEVKRLAGIRDIYDELNSGYIGSGKRMGKPFIFGTPGELDNSTVDIMKQMFEHRERCGFGKIKIQTDAEGMRMFHSAVQKKFDEDGFYPTESHRMAFLDFSDSDYFFDNIPI